MFTMQTLFCNGVVRHPQACFRPSRSCCVVVNAQAASQAMKLQYASFNDGSATKIAPFINGCWTLAGGHGSEVFQTFAPAYREYVQAGLTTFDTADIYGRSESILGSLHAQDDNADVALLTKYVPNIFQMRPTKANVQAAIQRSLDALQVRGGQPVQVLSETMTQVSQLDCVQLHWWDYSIPGMVDVGLWLAELKEEGLLQSVGVTNMDTQALQQLVEAGVPVVCNQVQFSLLDRRPLNGMVQYCQEHNIKLFTYGSLGGGLLSDRYYQEPQKGLFGGNRWNNITLNTSSLKMYWNVAKRFGGQELYQELLSALRSVATKHNCSIANVAMSWVMGQGAGALVHPIIGLRDDKNLEDNLKALNVHLTPEDHDIINAVLAKSTGPTGDVYSFERSA